MVKRKVGALEKVDADLYVMSTCTISRDAANSCPLRANLQNKIRRDPMYDDLVLEDKLR